MKPLRNFLATLSIGIMLTLLAGVIVEVIMTNNVMTIPPPRPMTQLAIPR